jgi:hypothetical protein
VRVSAAALVALLAFAAAACGSLRGGAAKPEAPVTQAQLAIMVVPQEDLGTAYETMETDADSGRTTSREFADGTPDPEDSGESVKRDGWRAGYELGFTKAGLKAVNKEEGLLGLNTSVDLFASESAARAEMLKYVRFFENHVGEKVEGIKIERFETFDVPVGDDAWGTEWTIAAGGLRVSGTQALFHRGRVVGSVVVARADEASERPEALRVARLLDGRIERALSGELRGEPAPVARPKISRAKIAKLTLGARDFPVTAKVTEEHLDRTHDDHISYVRDFDLPGTRLGRSTVLSVWAETQVYGSASGVTVIKQIMTGPRADEFFRDVVLESLKDDGIKAAGVTSGSVRFQGAHTRGVLLTFRGPAGRFDALVAIVDRARTLAILVAFGPSDRVKAADVQTLADRARAKLR